VCLDKRGQFYFIRREIVREHERARVSARKDPEGRDRRIIFRQFSENSRNDEGREKKRVQLGRRARRGCPVHVHARYLRAIDRNVEKKLITFLPNTLCMQSVSFRGRQSSAFLSRRITSRTDSSSGAACRGKSTRSRAERRADVCKEAALEQRGIAAKRFSIILILDRVRQEFGAVFEER